MSVPPGVRGVVRARNRDGIVDTLTLKLDGTWDAPDALLAETLDSLFPLQDVSPAGGQPGAKLLHEVAALLGGTVELPDLLPTDPDAAY